MIFFVHTDFLVDEVLNVLNGDPCQIKSLTKSLGMVIDNHLTYRQHAEVTAEKANRKWNTISILRNNKRSLIIPTLILLYKTTLLPLLLYVSPIWFERNHRSMQGVQNNLIDRFSTVAIRQTLKVVKCYREYHLWLVYPCWSGFGSPG